jgi:1-acyl-sn-glycerol-3-phosphate acyltransferase
VKVSFYRHLKIVRGPPLPAFHLQRKAVVNSKDFQESLLLISQEKNISLEKLERQARREFNRIAARPKGILFSIAGLIARRGLRQLFSAVSTRGLQHFISAAKAHPVVLVPMHRSHLDYILLSSLLYESRLSPPFVAAGVNLNFFPIGWFLKGTGAFFVRRKARDNHVHQLVLNKYITYLTKHGFLQEFYIEGGRSRSGLMRNPRTGLLSMYIDAFFSGIRKDILFVPVSISYEHVIETGAYAKENTGAPKIKENFRSLLDASSIFKKRYGEVVVSFAEPISLAEYVETFEPQSDPNEDRRAELAEQLGLKINQTILSYFSPTASSFCYTALLLSPHYSRTEDSLNQTLRELVASHAAVKTAFGFEGDITNSLSQLTQNTDLFAGALVSQELLNAQVILDQQIYSLPGNKRFSALFYKNSCMHIFAPLSIVSIAGLLHGSFTRDMIQPLHHLFFRFCQLTPWEEFSGGVDALLIELYNRKCLKKVRGKFKFQTAAAGHFIPAYLLDVTQSLLWTLAHIHAHLNESEPYPNSGQAPLKDRNDAVNQTYPDKMEYSNFVQKLQRSYKTATYVGPFSRTEASALSMITAALEQHREQGIVSFSYSQDSPTDKLKASKYIHFHRYAEGEFELLAEINKRTRNWLSEQQADTFTSLIGTQTFDMPSNGPFE